MKQTFVAARIRTLSLTRPELLAFPRFRSPACPRDFQKLLLLLTTNHSEQKQILSKLERIPENIWVLGGRNTFIGYFLWGIERMEKWRLRLDSLLLLLIVFACWGLCICDSLDADGRALLSFREGVEVDPYGALSNWGKSGVNHCFWFGVECSDDGRAVSVNLRDLFLQGKLTSELARLNHLKSLILHNNSFSGSIPREISKMLKLKVLDLGYNNLSGPFPQFLLGIVSLKLVVLRNNKFTKDVSPKLFKLNVLSQLQRDEEMPSSNKGSVMRS